MNKHTIELTERELRIILAAFDCAREWGAQSWYGRNTEFDKLYERLLTIEPIDDPEASLALPAPVRT